MKRLSGSRVLIDRLDGSRPQPALLGALLASGGEGAVFEDTQRADFIIKIFHRPELQTDPGERQRRAQLLASKQPKIGAMLASAPKLQVERNTQTHTDVIQIAWPQEMVLDAAGGFMGFTMRRLDMASTTELTAWNNARSRKTNNLPDDDLTRLFLLANLAAVVAYVNEAGHAIVDLKGQNVRAYRSGGHICLLDCDGFAVGTHSAVYPADMATPEYLAPEHHGAKFDPRNLDETQDRFALAALIFEFLSGVNAHPCSGVNAQLPPTIPERIALRRFSIDPASQMRPHQHSQIGLLPDETHALFRRAFLAAAADRTTPLEWRDHLRALIYPVIGQTSVFQVEYCPRHPTRLNYGKGCPLCAGTRVTASAPVQITQPHARRPPPAAPAPKHATASPTTPAPSPTSPPRTPSPAPGAPGAGAPRASAIRRLLQRHPRIAAALSIAVCIHVWFQISDNSQATSTTKTPAVIESSVVDTPPRQPTIVPPPVDERPKPPARPIAPPVPLERVSPPPTPLPALKLITAGETPWDGVGHRAEESPQIRRRIARSLWAGQHEVTFEQWDACVASGGCGGWRPGDAGWGRGTRPVINVSWRDANAYAAWLSARTGENYRLPTEAEWEYLARAGTRTPYATGTDITMAQANFDGVDPAAPDTLSLFKERTVSVGTYAANQFGLHDMHGNVAEWVQDCATPHLSTEVREHPSDCNRRVVRGGAWASAAPMVRSGYRAFSDPNIRNNLIGFRVVRD
jgi:formylglycine-generating enzyme required for sulfatase activity